MTDRTHFNAPRWRPFAKRRAWNRWWHVRLDACSNVFSPKRMRPCGHCGGCQSTRSRFELWWVAR